MTERGVEAVRSMPRALQTRRVFHIDGRPISWVYFWREVWRPALELAQLPYRAPYNLRHTFAYWSLRAGVPIATVAREMGHTSTEQTFRVYGGWCREMGADAAACARRGQSENQLMRNARSEPRRYRRDSIRIAANPTGVFPTAHAAASSSTTQAPSPRGTVLTNAHPIRMHRQGTITVHSNNATATN